MKQQLQRVIPSRNGRDVVIQPGLSGNVEQFAPLIQILAGSGYGCLYGAPILRDGPFMDATPAVPDVGAWLRDQIALLDADTLLLTHSVGVFVAASVRESLPANCVGVLAVNSALATIGKFLDHPARTFLVSPAKSISALRLFALLSAPVPQSIKARVSTSERWSKAVLGDLVDTNAVGSEDRARLIRSSGDASVKSALWVNRKHWDLFVDRSSVPLPNGKQFLLVGGAEDPLGAREDLEEMSEMIPGSIAISLPGVRHSAPVEAPDALAELVDEIFGLSDRSG